MKPSERRILKTSAICHYLDLSIFLAKKLVFLIILMEKISYYSNIKLIINFKKFYDNYSNLQNLSLHVNAPVISLNNEINVYWIGIAEIVQKIRNILYFRTD